VPPGATYDEVIERALDSAIAVMVVWTAHSARSNWVKAEAAEGAARSMLIPVLLDDVRIPLEFRRLQSIDLRSWSGQADHPGIKSIVHRTRELETDGGSDKGSPSLPSEGRSVAQSNRSDSKDTRAQEVAKPAPRTFDVISTPAELKRLSVQRPLLLFTGSAEQGSGEQAALSTFRREVFEPLSPFLAGFDIGVAWANVHWFFGLLGDTPLAHHLEAQRLRFKGVFLVKNGEMVGVQRVGLWGDSHEYLDATERVLRVEFPRFGKP